MSQVGTLMSRELLVRPRRRWFYRRRLAVPMVGGLVLLVYGTLISPFSSVPSSAVGLSIFMLFSRLMMIGAIFLPPLIAAEAVAEERRNRTLPILWLTDLGARDLLLGKLLSSLFAAVVAVFSLLPLLLFSISLGGISAVQVLTQAGVILATIFLGSGVGLFAGAFCRRESRAPLTALLFLVLVYAVPAAAVLYVYAVLDSYEVLTPAADAAREFTFYVLSPVAAMAATADGQVGGEIFLNFAFCFVLGGALWLWAARVLPGRVREDSGARPSWRAGLQRWWAGLRRTRRAGSRPPITGNPVAWLDTTYRYGGRRSPWLKLLAVMFATAVLAFGWSVVGTLWVRGNLAQALSSAWTALWTDMESLLWLEVSVCWVIFMIGSANACGRAFLPERRARALAPLLCTPLRVKEIVAGKIRAIAWGMLPWLTGAVVCLLATVLQDPTEFEAVYMLPFLAWLGSAWLGASALAFYVSVRFRRAVGLVAAIAAAILYFFASMIGTRAAFEAGWLDDNTSGGPSWALLGGVAAIFAALYVITFFICLLMVFRNFRANILKTE